MNSERLNALSQRLFLSPYFLVFLAMVCFFVGLGGVPLFDLDEGAFTEATREMLESGVYAATYLDGEPRYDKPILFYWFQALSIKLLGFNEWAFRLPSAIAACLWAFAIFCFTREFFNKERAQAATAFMITCLWVGVIARSAIADALLNLFLTLTLFDIWRYISNESKPAILRVYLWMALGTLTKGPVAVVVPVAVSFLYLISARELARNYQAYFNVKGWFIYFSVVTPWLVAVWYTQPGFFEGFLGDHNLSRFTATRENHGGSPAYYFGALPLILMPITGLLFVTLRYASKIWQSPINRFLSIWFLVIFCIFSFSKTQLPHYILNSCVPLFILLATIPSLNSDYKHRWTVAFGLVFIAILVALPELLEIAANDSKGYDAAMLANHAQAISPYYRVFAIFVFLLGLLSAFVPSLKTWQRITCIGLLLNILVFSFVIRSAFDLQQKPIHNAIAFLEEHYPNQEVVAYRIHMPTFSVYRNRITPLRAPRAGELALVRIDRIESIRNLLAPLVIKELHSQGGLVIIKVEEI